jgi:hypothetical protein
MIRLWAPFAPLFSKRVWQNRRRQAASAFRRQVSIAITLDRLEKWEFYIVPTAVIDEELGNQKTVALGRTRALTNPVGYSRLRERVDEALARGS